MERSIDEEFQVISWPSLRLVITRLCPYLPLLLPLILSIPEQRCNNAGLSVHRNESKTGTANLKYFAEDIALTTVMYLPTHSSQDNVISEEPSVSVFLPCRLSLKPLWPFTRCSQDYYIPFINSVKLIEKHLTGIKIIYSTFFGSKLIF